MKNLAEKIKKGYIKYVSENGKAPTSVSAFAEGLKIEEKDFYAHFNGFEAVEQEIWLDFYEEAIGKVKAQEVYQEYSAREKALSFYFNLLETLKESRTFVQAVAKNQKNNWKNAPLKLAKDPFHDFARDILHEGTETGEVVSRMFVSDRYPDALWAINFFVLNFWVSDTSADFQKTDEAVEKAVNLAFDLMAKTPLDSAFDFAKFLIQNKWGS